MRTLHKGGSVINEELYKEVVLSLMRNLFHKGGLSLIKKLFKCGSVNNDEFLKSEKENNHDHQLFCEL